MRLPRRLLLAAAVLPGAALADPISFVVESRAGRLPADQVQLTLTTNTTLNRSVTTRPMAIADLAGFDRRLLASGGTLRFAIRRPAGQLDCAGPARGGRASGSCRFTADRTFADALVERGIARPTADQSYQLALRNVGLELVEEIRRQHFPTPTPNQLVACAVHGIGADYLRAIAGAGYRPSTIEKLVAFRIHGITPAWIAGLVAADRDLTRLSADELVALRIHGVSPDWVRGLAAEGYRGLSGGQLVSMRIHGVTPDFVRRTKARTGDVPSPERLVQLRILGPLADRGR
jgi:hypothetical protein